MRGDRLDSQYTKSPTRSNKIGEEAKHIYTFLKPAYNGLGHTWLKSCGLVEKMSWGFAVQDRARSENLPYAAQGQLVE
jgi:hypothetical protein